MAFWATEEGGRGGFVGVVLVGDTGGRNELNDFENRFGATSDEEGLE